MDGDPDLPQLNSRLNNGPNVGENKDYNHLDEQKWRKHSQMFPHLPILLDLLQECFCHMIYLLMTTLLDIFEVSLS